MNLFIQGLIHFLNTYVIFYCYIYLVIGMEYLVADKVSKQLHSLNNLLLAVEHFQHGFVRDIPNWEDKLHVFQETLYYMKL